jgi:N utilization substance protein A
VQSIIRELRGEKIDIVQWAADLQQYAINSLKPARVNRVTVLDSEERHLEVVVDEDQLSLAIGKRGQNVRLAGKLLNAKIDIKSEEDKKRDVEIALLQMASREEAVGSLDGVGPKTAEALVAAGVKTVGAAIDAGVEGLTAVAGIGPKGAEKILAAAEVLLAAAVPDEPEVPEVAPPSPDTAEAPSESDSATVSASLTADVAAAEAGQTDETDEVDEPDEAAVEELVVAEAEAVVPADDEEE